MAAKFAALSTLDARGASNWLSQAPGLDFADAALQSSGRFLHRLLAVLTPKETAPLPNFPNPFNVDTWIPYQLARGAEVEIAIYDIKGRTVRRLALGRQAAGYYVNRERAAYWDGRNESGKPVGSGGYIYRLRAGDVTTARRMEVVK